MIAPIGHTPLGSVVHWEEAVNAQAGTLDLRREIRLLLQIAMVVFVYTIIVGILNGTEAVDFQHRTLMTHVHGGTLGWITMSAIASGMWLFGHEKPGPSSHQSLARAIAYATPLLIVAYVIAFSQTTGELRPAIGTLVGLTLLAFLAWVAMRARYVTLTVPHVAFLAAAATSVTGAVFGILLGLQLATGDRYLPDDGEDAHPATMVIGFLVPVGMAVAELGLRGFRNLPEAGRLGTAQIAFPFVGGILVALGILLDATPLIGLSLPFEIIGVGIMLKRLSPLVRSGLSTGETQARFASLSMIVLVIDLCFFVYLVVRYKGDFDDVPTQTILALDHMMFIGVITNGVLAIAQILTANRSSILKALETPIFLGINTGLAIFVVGLLLEEATPKQIGTPIMGVSILLALALYTLRLNVWESSGETLEPVTSVSQA
jgi:hypothetical protein